MEKEIVDLMRLEDCVSPQLGCMTPTKHLNTRKLSLKGGCEE
jgi:hypothetical protein